MRTGNRLRRVAASAAIASALAIGPAAAASAATPAPDPGGICASAPRPYGNSQSAIGGLDITAPTKFNADNGLYSKYGAAGFATSVTYDPGCIDKALSWVSSLLGPTAPGVALGSATETNGPSRVAKAGLGIAVAGVIAPANVVRFAVGPGGLWPFVDLIAHGLNIALGVRIMMAFLSFGLICTGIHFLWRASHDSLSDVMTKIATGAAIIAVGVGVAAYSFTLSPYFDSLTDRTYVAAGEVSTGKSTTDVDAGTAYADAMYDAFLMRLWGVVNLGPSSLHTIDTYAPRLFAATAFTRDEDAKAAADPAYAARLTQQKYADFKQVAAEIKQADPNAYVWLTGRDADGRVVWAFLGAFASILIAVPTIVAAGIVAMSRVAIRILCATIPAISVVTQHPKLQKYGILIAHFIVGAAWASVLAVVSLIAYLTVLTAALSNPAGTWLERVVACCVFAGLLIWAWQKRNVIAEKANLIEQKRFASKVTRSAAGYARSAGSVAGRYGERDWERRNAWRKDSDSFAGFETRPDRHPDLSVAPAAMPAASAADRETVKATITAKSDARVTAKAANKAFDTSKLPGKASRTEVVGAINRVTTDKRNRALPAHAMNMSNAPMQPRRARTVTSKVVKAASREAVAAAVPAARVPARVLSEKK